ncbi:MAG: gamma-glutamyltransferase [Planctomycetota bacterium]|nr:gamma-glutamyltransferase [Planctomycetota bacterium]
MPNKKSNRRSFLVTSTLAVAASSLTLQSKSAARNSASDQQLVSGQTEAAEVGNQVLDKGGNAIDAIVAAALVAGVVAIPSTGIGGYGGHLIVGGLPGGKVSAIDLNTAAPAAMRENSFQADENGKVKDAVNNHGWQSVGVPGVLAGLQKALDLFGTRTFADSVQPAIRYAADGFTVSKGLAVAFKNAENRFRRDVGSAKLFLSQDHTTSEGSTFRNPELARLLESLAETGNVAPFYHGEFAQRVASQSQANGGMLTAEDFANYEAHVVEPLSIQWNGYRVHTPPPTSGGLTVLQVLAILNALGWPDKASSPEIELVEASRVAWSDRLASLGDPKFNAIPWDRLLSSQAASETADRIREAIQGGAPLKLKSDGRTAGGTIHLNATDKNGLTAALTFTHGDGFGSHVTADGLGMLLGHGLSRFDPRPGRANSPGPCKRPLHNMCPTLVTRGDQVVLAVGATGGRRIVSAVTNVLARYIGQGESLEKATQHPRIHTEGDLTITVDAKLPNVQKLVAFGYQVSESSVGSFNSIERKPSGEAVASKR